MKVIVCIFFLFFPAVSAQTPYDSLYLKSAAYRHQTALHALSRISSAEIVFLGNSITFGGNWGELLGRNGVVNRGIGGDNTVGMLHRLSFVRTLKPKLCFLMAGINDLYADAPPETVFAHYRKILDTLRLHRIVPVIQSTLLVNPKWKRTEEKNRQVEQLNRMLSEFAAGHAMDFVDLNAVLSADGKLRDEYTTDGVHLTPAAYGVWRDALVPVLEKYRTLLSP